MHLKKYIFKLNSLGLPSETVWNVKKSDPKII